MVSCICHDLDHRGTTNSFQMQSGTVLANLYSSDDSVMEVNDYNFVRFYVLTVVIMKMAGFWDVVPCSVVQIYHVS
jgi:hypothetical protein